MKYFDGFSQAIMLHSFIFFTFCTVLDFIKRPDYLLCAHVLWCIELAWFVVGLVISIAVIWHKIKELRKYKRWINKN